MTKDIEKSDLSARLRVKAERLRACLGMIYEPKWREIFIQTAALFDEAAKEIDGLHSELFWAHMLRQDAQVQLKHLREKVAREDPIPH